MAKLITKAEMTKLLSNGAKSASSEGGIDHKPVVKIFNPYGNQTWLLSEIDPANPDIAFGLCDLGFETPEIGSVSISELERLRVGPGKCLKLERDRWFTAKHTLVGYANTARTNGRLVA